MHYNHNGPNQYHPHQQYNPQQQNVYIVSGHRKPVLHWSWHLSLTILTGGMWGLVWMYLIATGKR